MAPGKRGKKSVRIIPGHQERIIERQNNSRRPRQKKKSSRRSRNKNSTMHKSQEQPHWKCKTHRPSVAQVVYQYLERASNRRSAKNQKTNATNQFRHLQRRKQSKRLRPDLPKRIRPKIEAINELGEQYRFPNREIPSGQETADKSIEECIYEVLSFGTILGLLEPADDKGMMFRVASDIALFENTNKNNQARDQASQEHLELHGLDDCTEEKYCDC